MQKVCNVIMILLLVAVCFGLFVCYSMLSSMNAANTEKPEEIDRTSYVIYPKKLHDWENAVMICYEKDKYYHGTPSCSFVRSDKKTDSLRVSRYEAVERGFQPCPNCYFPDVDIRKK